MSGKKPAPAQGTRTGPGDLAAGQQHGLPSTSSSRAQLPSSEAGALPRWEGSTLKPFQVAFRSEHTGWQWCLYTVSEDFADNIECWGSA